MLGKSQALRNGLMSEHKCIPLDTTFRMTMKRLNEVFDFRKRGLLWWRGQGVGWLASVNEGTEDRNINTYTSQLVFSMYHSSTIHCLSELGDLLHYLACMPLVLVVSSFKLYICASKIVEKCVNYNTNPPPPKRSLGVHWNHHVCTVDMILSRHVLRCSTWIFFEKLYTYYSRYEGVHLVFSYSFSSNV